MNKVIELSVLSASLMGACTSHKVDRSEKCKQPNVIFFLADDMGYGDLSIHGNPYLTTSNLDSFATNGVEFLNFYVCPASAPTRAGILTGRYTFRTKTTDVGDTTSYMSPDEITIAEVLKANGYMTGLFGKWHLGENYPLNPSNQGFDEVVWHHFSNITDDFPVGNSYFSPHLFHNGKLEKQEGFCLDVYVNEAIKMIKKAREENKPFFVYLPSTLLHGPLQVPEKYSKPFIEKGIAGKTAKVFGMMQNVDENFGRLIKVLDELSIRDNTLVIYTSDNGPASSNLQRYNANLKGIKGFMYEGGVKVPCFMQFPKAIHTSRKIEMPTSYIDIFPTILDFCNIPNPAGITIDGRSLMPLATKDNPEWEERNIYCQHRLDLPMDPYRHIMVRNNRYKLIQEDESGQSKERLKFLYLWCDSNGYKNFRLKDEIDFELYDLINDPFEKNNIADKNPDIVEKLRREYVAWYHDVFSSRGFNRPVLKLNSGKENPVYLTSNSWLLPRDWTFVVETPGKFDITVYWGNLKKNPKTLYLDVAGKMYEIKITEKEGQHTFENIEIPSGYQKVQSWVNDKNTKLSITTEIKKR